MSMDQSSSHQSNSLRFPRGARCGRRRCGRSSWAISLISEPDVADRGGELQVRAGRTDPAVEARTEFDVDDVIWRIHRDVSGHPTGIVVRRSRRRHALQRSTDVDGRRPELDPAETGQPANSQINAMCVIAFQRTQHPGVMIEGFTGGAHCCEVPVIYLYNGPNRGYVKVVDMSPYPLQGCARLRPQWRLHPEGRGNQVLLDDE